MAIMLGNVTVEQIERRIGIEFPEAIKKYMLDNYQHEASNVKPGKWHCFDLPFTMLCGDAATAKMIYESIKDRSSEIKEVFQIAFEK